MATKELDKENMLRVLKGDTSSVIKACVNCKHYSKTLFEQPLCTRKVYQGFHPVSGKKSWLGETYECRHERKFEDCTSIRRSNNPCGKEGEHFKEKDQVKWFQSWFKK